MSLEITIYVDDVMQTLAFYQNVFGMEIKKIDSLAQWLEMELGGISILFVSAVHRPVTIDTFAQNSGGFPLNPYLTFTFPTIEEVYEKALKQKAVSIEAPTLISGIGNMRAIISDKTNNIVIILLSKSKLEL